jgi:GNAT superfamily N-acetyltransferase
MYKVLIDYAPSQSDNNVIMEGLIQFYEKATGQPRDKEFSIFLKDHLGIIVGGLQAHFDIESIYIEIFWIDEKRRNQGHGKNLLEAAEKEALKNGCTFSIIDTLSFQAEGFYLKNGYQRIGEIKNYCFEHSRIFLKKNLR